MCLLCHVAGLDQLKYVVEGLLPEEMIMKNANNSDHWNERKGHRDPRFTLSIVDRGFIWCESAYLTRLIISAFLLLFAVPLIPSLLLPFSNSLRALIFFIQ